VDFRYFGCPRLRRLPGSFFTRLQTEAAAPGFAYFWALLIFSCLLDFQIQCSMSLKSSARIKKRRSEAAAATYPIPLASPAQAGIGNANGGSSSTPNPGANITNNVGNSGSNPCQSSSKKHSFVGRNPNFDTDETKLLIQLWGDPKLQRTLITTHKKHAVICQLAAKMQEYGYHRSPEEITTRIKNLKCFYNRLKKDKECGGQSTDSEPSWKHFAEMDAIMTRPIFSVRPNEVPAPSLKYQLEQALEEHAERRKRRLENGEELSESDNEEDDMLLSALVSKNKESVGSKALEAGCLESDLDMNEESFSKRRKLSAEVDVDIGEALTSPCIKNEPALDVEPTTVAPPVEPEPEDDDDCMLLPQTKSAASLQRTLSTPATMAFALSLALTAHVLQSVMRRSRVHILNRRLKSPDSHL